jgi:hypothetical protein
VVAQEPCSLAPVFLLLHDAAGADVIGECTGVSSLTEAGELVQSTTRGTLVLRIPDGVPAFTDGATTWLYGPDGIQSRPNGERFAWETSPPVAAPVASPAPASIETPAADPPPPPVVAAVPSPSATVSKLTDALAARCFRLTTSDRPVPFEARQTDNMMCRLSAEKWGEPGVICVETAVAEADRAIRQPRGPDAGNTYLTTLLLCQAGLSK